MIKCFEKIQACFQSQSSNINPEKIISLPGSLGRAIGYGKTGVKLQKKSPVKTSTFETDYGENEPIY